MALSDAAMFLDCTAIVSTAVKRQLYSAIPASCWMPPQSLANGCSVRLQLNGLEDNDSTGGKAFGNKAVKMSLLITCTTVSSVSTLAK